MQRLGCAVTNDLIRYQRKVDEDDRKERARIAHIKGVIEDTDPGLLAEYIYAALDLKDGADFKKLFKQPEAE